MRKPLFVLIAVLFPLTSCVKWEAETLPRGEEVSVSFVTSLDVKGGVKAAADMDGTGVFADQCKLQVWCGDAMTFEKTVPVNNLKATFEHIVLVKGQKYDFLFWADNKEGAYYQTDNLKNVRLSGDHIGCNESRDAFYASAVDMTPDEAFSETIILHRPFAQLNLIATDYPDVYKMFPDPAKFASLTPDKVGLKLTVPTVFNVKTGKASNPEEVSYVAPVYTKTPKTGEGDRNTLLMDYLYAPSEEGNVVDIEFSAYNDNSGLTKISHSLTNVPLRRNYRTNIVGPLVTVVDDVKVEVVASWNGEVEKQ